MDFDFHCDGISDFDDVGYLMSPARVSDPNKFKEQKSGNAMALRLELERLYMVTEALWGMLKETGKFTNDDLIERVAEIDLRDGKLDGQNTIKAGPTVCPQCERVMQRHRPTCLYCGTAVLQEPFAR